MSYSVTSYLTDAVKIEAVYGSRDEALLASLQAELSDALDDLNDDFSFDKNIGEGRNAQEVLIDIVHGETRFPELAYLYGYVYEKLCAHFGNMYEPPNEEYSTNYYWAVPKPEYKAFIPIHFSQDFPEIYSIRNSELAAEKERFLAVKSRKGIDGDYLKMEQEDFASAFDEASKSGKDLVFFLY